jgi:hypothetical protein
LFLADAVAVVEVDGAVAAAVVDAIDKVAGGAFLSGASVLVPVSGGKLDNLVRSVDGADEAKAFDESLVGERGLIDVAAKMSFA